MEPGPEALNQASLRDAVIADDQPRGLKAARLSSKRRSATLNLELGTLNCAPSDGFAS